jgi:2-oxoisovalerate dehydrogenase E1 component
MSIRREKIVADRLLAVLRGEGRPPGRGRTRREAEDSLDAPLHDGSGLSRRDALALFECALQSRLQDLEARRMKDRGHGFYTIGSAGHEANAVFGHLLRTTDPALLHYRSGAFMIARARRGRGETPLWDTMLSFTASAEDPVSGGRHKVFGSRSLWVPPQTSTIASHLPKAVGLAYAVGRMARLGLAGELPRDSIVYCSFGDASANHATAQAGFTAAGAAIMHRQPCPVLFVCEDNGLGISVRTPADYIERCFRNRAGLDWFSADGNDLPRAHDVARQAIDHCRRTRRPVFFHLRTVRLMGHAGTDLETMYLDEAVLAANESRDPLHAWTDLLFDAGALEPEDAVAMHDDLERRIRLAGEEAWRRPRLRGRAKIVAPLGLPAADSLTPPPAASHERRVELFGDPLPEADPRPRHLAFRIAQGLKDLLAGNDRAFVFGEDVARKGGVYHVTDGLHKAFGSGRVFNTILDETTILGLAQGMAQAGCLPIPEIQYLAYVHNALDQIRGEAASLQFFSAGRFQNPMVVRIAGYGYQKGFGGHFHNDDSVGALLDIPGLIIASPSRGDDAVRMLRTCAAAAAQQGKVCIFLEPIALYMTKDLHEPNDGEWLCRYPEPHETLPLGEPRIYEPPGDGEVSNETPAPTSAQTPGDVGSSERAQADLTIVSWANGAYQAVRVQRRLHRDHGIRARVLDLRWLAPLPVEAVLREAIEVGRVLVVDECRRTAGGPSALLLAAIAEHEQASNARVRRVASADTFVPLGPAADDVLVQESEVLEAALALCRHARRTGSEEVTR